MTVYVDKAQNSFGTMKMSHMVADTDNELHAMAEKIGLKREWFQVGSMRHYDVSQSKRKLAIEYGAQEISDYDLVKLIRRLREEDV